MTPLQFEARYAQDWNALEAQLGELRKPRRQRNSETLPTSEEFAARYRRVCEQLAVARERGYPAFQVDRLQRLVTEAHHLIYHQGGSFGLAALREFLVRGFPQCVARHRRLVLLSATLLFLPMLVTSLLVYNRPELILAVMDAGSAQELVYMYSSDAESLGRHRDVTTDWAMFGFYIQNNVGIAFRCFAGGLFLGVGTLFFVIYNGALIGAAGGFLAERGLAPAFFSFVSTHSSFELLGIVLSGAAGLRLGFALLAPGRLTRRSSLVQATRDVTPLIYGFTILFLIAAAIEAFWSSSQWIPPTVKYPVAVACWTGLLAYLTLQGRRAD